VVLIGLIIIFTAFKWKLKVLGVCILATGPAAYSLMTTAWPEALGLDGETIGIKQRSALFVLWMAMLLLLALGILKGREQSLKI